jgi:hypothetical protein
MRITLILLKPGRQVPAFKVPKGGLRQGSNMVPGQAAARRELNQVLRSVPV